jgi:hypothetical protein
MATPFSMPRRLASRNAGPSGQTGKGRPAQRQHCSHKQQHSTVSVRGAIPPRLLLLTRPSLLASRLLQAHLFIGRGPGVRLN